MFVFLRLLNLFDARLLSYIRTRYEFSPPKASIRCAKKKVCVCEREKGRALRVCNGGCGGGVLIWSFI